MTPNGQRQSAGFAPAVVETPTNSGAIQRDGYRYVGHAFAANNTSRAFVSALIGIRRPLDVSNLIMSVVVFTVQRMLGRRTAPDTCQKLLVRREPEPDATLAVIFEFWVVGIVTTIFGVVKRGIFWRYAVRAVTVLSLIFSRLFSAPTPATMRRTRRKVAVTGHNDVATQTSAPPELSLAALTGISDNGEAIERATCQVNEKSVCRQGLQNYVLYGVNFCHA